MKLGIPLISKLQINLFIYLFVYMQTWPLEFLISVCKYVGNIVWIMILTALYTAVGLPTLLEILPQHANHVWVNGGESMSNKERWCMRRREEEYVCVEREIVAGHVCLRAYVIPTPSVGWSFYCCFSWKRFFSFYYIFNVFLQQLVGGDCSAAFQFSRSCDGYPTDVVWK